MQTIRILRGYPIPALRLDARFLASRLLARARPLSFDPRNRSLQDYREHREEQRGATYDYPHKRPATFIIAPYMTESKTQPQRTAEPAQKEREPRWPAMLAVLAVGGLNSVLPERLSFGPFWLLLAVVSVLLVPTVITHPTRPA